MDNVIGLIPSNIPFATGNNGIVQVDIGIFQFYFVNKKLYKGVHNDFEQPNILYTHNKILIKIQNGTIFNIMFHLPQIIS